MPELRPLTILCMASYCKGVAFLRAAKQLGCTVLLLTRENQAEENWPHESIDEIFYMPDLRKRPDIIYAVSYIARSYPIDQIVALDDFDVDTAGALRDHLRLPGLSESHARHFRDKLAMRTITQAAGIPVPEFTSVFNYDRLREFMGRVPPPWLLKPRSEASAMGIITINHADEIWPTLDRLGDMQSYHLLERFLPGDVFHVDGLVQDGELIFAEAHRYGRPPMSVAVPRMSNSSAPMPMANFTSWSAPHAWGVLILPKRSSSLPGSTCGQNGPKSRSPTCAVSLTNCRNRAPTTPG
ncbi:MAG: uncharacterized protein H6Q38_2221 [Chloroflexi bacterium]|nr:uncharacterized protein [Chloroflexota bacterium]